MTAAKPPPPVAPSRSWTEMLAAFMEQRNIRWGELIGGLLFVCSSVALVVSLWETLERIPYSKFFIFVSISSAVFGVGLYAHHRWKLESTSRALLVIATLLVPLNFVAMASMAKGEWTLLTLVSELVSLAIFAYLVGLAARILVPDGRWLTVAAVLGDSIAVLLTAQLVRADSPAWLMVGSRRAARGALCRRGRLLPLLAGSTGGPTGTSGGRCDSPTRRSAACSRCWASRPSRRSWPWASWWPRRSCRWTRPGHRARRRGDRARAVIGSACHDRRPARWPAD